MTQNDQSIGHLVNLVRDFADRREWGQFHTPRNLILALVGEVGELAAEVQWMSDADVDALAAGSEKREAIEAEMADVLNYLLRLSDVLGVDLVAALKNKLAVNESRYPADKARGSSDKYTKYE